MVVGLLILGYIGWTHYSDAQVQEQRRSAPTTVPSLPTSDGPTTYPPGGYNDEGCPKDQWVDGYTRRDGTRVRGHWRNSGNDGCGD